MSGRFLVFLALAVENEQGELEGQLAERWEHSDDYRTWTYYIRRGLRWHDGEPVTGHDVKFTWDLQADRRVLNAAPSFIEAIELLDDFTLRVRYRKPQFRVDDWDVYYPKHILEKLDPSEFYSWDFWKEPIGNGPYRYVRHVPKTMIELEANPDYFRGKPAIERLVLRFGGNKLVELLSGNVQIATHINRNDVAKLETDPRFVIYHQAAGGTFLPIYWNQKNPILGDVRVRRALTYAIDRRALARATYLPDDVRLTDVISTHGLERRDELPPPLPYDPDAAARLLDEANWRDTDGDGIRDRDGSPLRFSALVIAGGSYEGNAMPYAVVFVQAAFRAIGVQMDIESLAAGVVRQRVRSGQFDAAFVRFFDRLRSHLVWLGPESPMGYFNPAVYERLLKASEASNPEEQDALYREINEFIQEDLPFTILFPQLYSHVVDRRIHGLSSPYRADPVWNMEFLSFEKQ
jgi:peptide/nickel transport system substrate-binding protein